jgi:hypothetical protein
MGHYASDLMCDDCGELRCRCERTPAPQRTEYIVLNDFSVCTTEEFLASKQNGLEGRMHLAFKEKYKSRRAAEKNARISCEVAVEQARQNLIKLKNICKVLRPWEKKSK